MKQKPIPYFGIVLFSITLSAAIFYPSIASSQDTMMRVAILKDVKTFTLSIRGKYTIINPRTNQELANGRRLQKSKVILTSNGIMISDQKYLGDRIRIVAQKDASLYVKKKRFRYRGQIDIIRDTKTKILVVNRLGIEDYVKGVLYHEVPNHWPLTAIKAQAVATRTYALYQSSERVEEKYDVTSDIYSQVYGGRNAERHRSNIAASRTRGQILTFRDKVLPAYFHSTCGGQTENVSELWKHNLSPLKGIQCGFCTRSPHYRWKKNFRSEDIQDKLNANGYRIGLIKKIETMNYTESNRIKTLQITGRNGKFITLSGTRFREIIGPNKLKSNDYDIDMKGYYFDATGHGWGHGVGMCQWGAYQMSKEKYKYTDILRHYYPGTNITDMTEL